MLFNSLGRNIPSASCRVFSQDPRDFYKIDKLNLDYKRQHKVANEYGLIPDGVKVGDVITALSEIESQIRNNDNYKNIFLGTPIPFCFNTPIVKHDIGACLEDKWLPMLKMRMKGKFQALIVKQPCKGIQNSKGQLHR